MDTKKANTDRFDAMAPEWNADADRVRMGQGVAEAVLAAVSPTGSEQVFEFGAGTGLVTAPIAPKVASVAALDGSAGMLAVLRATCARKGLTNVEIIEGNVPEDLPARTFDLIYSSMTLHHVEDVRALIGILAEHVKPGGRIALADLDAEDGSFHGDVPGVAHHGFDRDAVCGWLRDAGFTDVRASTAFTVQRSDGGGARDYPIFLAVGTKPRA